MPNNIERSSGFTQGRYEQHAARLGAVGVPGGCGPDHGAVRQLFIAPAAGPAPKSFEQVMFSAQRFEVGGVRGPTAIIRNRMVDIAEVRGTLTPREPARQITAANEIRQRRRRPVTRLRWGIAGMNHRAQFGDPPLRQIGQHTRRHRESAHDEPEPRHRARYRRPRCFRAARLPDHLHEAFPGGDHLERMVLIALTMHIGAIRGLQHRSLSHHMHHHRRRWWW